MDWIDTKVGSISDAFIGEDLPEQRQYCNNNNNEHCSEQCVNNFRSGSVMATAEQNSQHVFRSGRLIHVLSDTDGSCEKMSLKHEELININDVNCENMRTENSFVGSNFCESMLQLSCLGADSTDLTNDLLSPAQFNDSETEWLLSECDNSNLNAKARLEWSGHSGKVVGVINNFTEQDSGSGGSRRPYCLGNSNSKNAIAARDNRQKKKRYIAELEESVSNLQVENEHLREESKKNGHTLCALQNEVSYLREVIANQSTLSAILKNVMKTPGITLTTSFTNAVNCRSSKEKMSADDSTSQNCARSNAGSSKNIDFPGVDAHEQVDSVSDSSVTSSRILRKASKTNTKGKMLLAPGQKKSGFAQENKQLAAAGKTFGETDISSDSTENIKGGICLHVSEQNVSLEFCHLCNKNAYLGIITDHSYVKV